MDVFIMMGKDAIVLPIWYEICSYYGTENKHYNCSSPGLNVTCKL